MTDQPKERHPCREPAILEAYALSRLPAAERSAVDEHCRGCAECRQLLEEELRLVAGVRRMGRTQMKERLTERLSQERARQIPWPRIAAVAATILIVAGVSVIGFWLQERGPETTTPQLTMPAEPQVATDHGRNRPEPDATPRNGQESASLKTKDMARAVEGKRVASGENKPDAVIAHAESEGGYWTEGIVSTVPPSAAGAQQMDKVDERFQPALEAQGAAARKAAAPSIALRQQVVLSQQPFPLLEGQKQLSQAQGGKKGLPTLIRQDGDRLSLTLYPDTLFPPRDLQQAVVRRAGNDTLLIQVGSQLIKYRLPDSLLKQQPAR